MTGYLTALGRSIPPSAHLSPLPAFEPAPQLPESLSKPHGSGGLSFAQRRGGDGGDLDVLSVRPCLGVPRPKRPSGRQGPIALAACGLRSRRAGRVLRSKSSVRTALPGSGHFSPPQALSLRGAPAGFPLRPLTRWRTSAAAASQVPCPLTPQSQSVQAADYAARCAKERGNFRIERFSRVAIRFLACGDYILSGSGVY